MVFVSQTPKLRTNKGFYRHGASTDSTSRPDGTNENEVESGVSSAVGGSPNLFSDHAIVIATSNHGGHRGGWVVCLRSMHAASLAALQERVRASSVFHPYIQGIV